MKYDAEVAAAVAQAGRIYGVAVDPALVHAVIEQETRHGALKLTGTREPDGHYSYGPMQVKDTTAAMHGVSEPSTLAIPSVGIRIGTYELARLLRLFPGDTTRAIAAYNAGPGNANRNAAGRFPNQPYVDAVLSFWNVYKGAVMASGAALAAIALVAWLVLRVMRRGAR
jgi:soluble lytic murein transglycosylase-like protein